MRTVNCLICGSDRRVTVEDQDFKDVYIELIDPTYQNEPRRLVVCQECGFVYHDPQFDSTDVAVLYDKFRDSCVMNESPDEYFDRITSLPNGQSENYAKIEWIHGVIPDFMKDGGCLLDIGCGGGVFIRTFLDNNPGWTACGVEPTSAFAELAGRRLNLPVVTGNYLSGLFPGRRFDLISINQVLEHIIDPATFLRDVHNDLAAGGYIYLEVPDVLDLAYLPPDHDRFRMQHLWVFSKASLTNICRRAGFEVITVDQQVTVRQKRNLVALLSISAFPDQTALLRDDPEWVLSRRQQYSDTIQMKP